jgi:drug/metabolite transporter (DMT)-like permease
MKKKAHLAGIIFAIIFGFSFLFSKIALGFVSPVGLIAYRFLIAFLIFELLRRFKIITIRFKNARWQDWLVVSLFEPVLYFFFETYGLEHTSSGEAGMMIALIPIFVSLLGAIVLKEKPRLIQYFFIFLSVAGILFIQFAKPGTPAFGETLGFILLFGAVLSAAIFNIASRNASTRLKPYEITYFMMLSAAVVFNCVYLLQLAIGDGMGAYFTNMAHIELLLPILYLGIIASIGGYFLVNYTLSKLPAHVTSIYSNLSTIVAIIAGAVILHEQLLWYHYVGSLMIIIGVYGTVRTNHGIERDLINDSNESRL